MPAILRVFTLTVTPENPVKFSLPGLCTSLTRDLAALAVPATGPRPDEKILYRYPALQCKQVKGDLMVLGICQGAAFLRQVTEGTRGIGTGDDRCAIASRDEGIRNELFGIDGRMHQYEFLTPWLALNQQHAKKFYDLSGRAARDAFMEKLLLSHLNTLAKSLDAVPDDAVTCTARVKFRHERIDRENTIVFTGTFATNLRIPDYLGIGRSVAQGYGTVREQPGQPAPQPGGSGR